MIAIRHVRHAAPSLWAHGLDLRTLPDDWVGKEVNPSRASLFWLKVIPLCAPTRQCCCLLVLILAGTQYPCMRKRRIEYPYVLVDYCYRYGAKNRQLRPSHGVEEEDHRRHDKFGCCHPCHRQVGSEPVGSFSEALRNTCTSTVPWRMQN